MIIPGGSDQFGKGGGKRYPLVYMDEKQGDKKGEILAKGIRDIGGAAVGLMMENKRHEDSMELINEEKLKKAQDAKDKSELELNVINYKGLMTDTARNIFEDQEIPSDKKFEEFNKKAVEIKNNLSASFPEDSRYAVEPIHAESMRNVKNYFYEKHSAQLKDEALANTQTTIETLERQSAVDPGERFKSIALLNQLEMPGVTKAGKQKIINEFVERTADTEITNRINSGKLQELIDDLKAKDKGKNYTYLKGMDPKTRQHYIGSVKSELDRLKAAAESRAKNAHKEWERGRSEERRVGKECRSRWSPYH